MSPLRKPKARALAIGIPSLLMVAVLGWLVGGWLHLSGLLLWAVRAVVWILGGLVVYLVLKLFPASAAPAGRSGPDPVLELLDQARKHLNASGVRGRGVLRKLPVLLVLGPRGSAKTTFVHQSGLDAEHLAGNLLSGDMIAPTELLNVWYHDGHVLMEAGGPLAVDPGRWARLVERLQPKKWLPALLGRPQAPRVAIVCFSAEELVGGGDAVVPTARNFRDRLAQLSESIGIRLPVYVVFTKADAITHFTEFVKNLTPPEIQELLGTTLRASGDAPSAASYQERESERLGGAIEELFRSLAERRLAVLGRSGTLEDNGAAYEFPREFRKISRVAVQFLVELCRPSQLRVSPFLRGFYFAGVRPIMVEGDAPAPQASTPFQESSPQGATQVFDLQAMQQQARAAEPVPKGGRRVPQWVFLDGILRRVVLRDRVAMGITTSGFGLSILRRFSMAVGIAAVLLLGVLIVGSHHSDARLQRRTRAAITGVANLSGSPVGLPSVEDLQRLDTLRAVTAQLSHYENGRRPFRSLLFMYTGGSLYPVARRVYFSHFKNVLFDRAFANVRQELQSLPPKPTLDQYDQVYRALKAYMEVAQWPGDATEAFFGDALTDIWADGAQPLDTLRALAHRQFAFLGAELPHGNPYQESLDTAMVNLARSFLADNTNENSFYASLVAQWDRLPSASLERDRPGTLGFLTGAPAVPGAFTRTGWDSVHASLAGIGKAASLDLHVVGTQFFDLLRARGFEPQSVAPHLQSRYEQDYRDHWVDFLRKAHLESQALKGGQAWLTSLGGVRSPMFQFLAYVDSETKVGSPGVDSAFQAVRGLIAPDTLPQLFSDATGKPYLQQIQALAQSVGQLAAQPGVPSVSDAVRSASSDGLKFVQQIQLDFPTEPTAAQTTGNAVGALLASPFQWANQQVGQGPQLAANQLAQEFCSRQDGRVFGRYPFRAGATAAALQDVDALLNPTGGALGKFFQDAEGTGATLDGSYDRFRTQARSIQSALYPPGASGPRFDFLFQVRGFQGIDRVELRVDGHSRVFTPVQRDRESFTWDGARAEQANLFVQSGQRPDSIGFSGTWALFRLFHQATWESAGTGSYHVTWAMPGGTRVSADVSVRGGAPILERNYLTQFTCPRRIAR